MAEGHYCFFLAPRRLERWRELEEESCGLIGGGGGGRTWNGAEE